MYGIDATEWMRKIYAHYKKRAKGKDPITQKAIAEQIRFDQMYLNRIFRKVERGEKIHMRILAAEIVRDYAEKLK